MVAPTRLNITLYGRVAIMWQNKRKFCRLIWCIWFVNNKVCYFTESCCSRFSVRPPYIVYRVPFCYAATSERKVFVNQWGLKIKKTLLCAATYATLLERCAVQFIELFQLFKHSGLFDSAAKHQGYILIFSCDFFLHRFFPCLGQDPRVVA